MQHLDVKKLRNLTVEQLDEIKREIGHAVASLNEEIRQSGSRADYMRKRNLEKYLDNVKAVLQHKRNTGQR
ncbi:hypothetical protein ACQ46_gp114 [Citrobacter phage Moon]|uniref:50S ribosomal protein L29 n=3 Tax=Moonvirus TaxID=1985329 RepID=A0A0K1LMQ2_9CAUD|nr:hypothetical protein ACQ46_gp114 [Citrobacter phage Moon]YP_009203827.1 hypothetical protein CPT_Merlin113 [Citrobacter phage Merlin]YP_009618173.1 hypothetical protein FDI95_gp114 [Citrobacter phage CF1 ERZ-2017]YP_010843986.1 hypothetical protein PP427_gp130 [Salmonella phage KM16]WKV23457.1 hypothetical protein SEA1_gp0109 [Salmonella phage SEA1]AIX12085.1 hypothetical protein CPT_Moon114 [Citrobacter phage Moon]AKU43759.1 hypothetical protein CPT_Merlin113 [Citrobacter phage Merlin]AU